MMSWGKSQLWQSQRDNDVYWNKLVMSPVQVRFMSLKALSQIGLPPWCSRKLLTQHSLQNLCVASQNNQRICKIQNNSTIALLFSQTQSLCEIFQTSLVFAAEMLAQDWIRRTSLALATKLIPLDSNASCHFSAFCCYHLFHLYEYSHGWPLKKQRFQPSTSFLSQNFYACSMHA